LSPPTGIVYFVDGAGGYQKSRSSLESAVRKSGLALEVRSFDWNYPNGFGLADEVDVAHSRAQGERLAQELALCQSLRPGVPVYVVAYSAGCAVALAAADSLSPDSVERIVLLSPSVSREYDLRKALRAARSGMDVFFSERDRFWLGVGTAIVGTSDGKRQSAAGRVGFVPPADPLIARLRQYPWDPSVAWSGNTGGHSGTIRSSYLEAYVVPLLSPAGPR
jgi:pimeloyl-ACP methyl ester carboxylesterase